MVSVTQNDIIKFIQNQIAYRFGIPEAIMDDQGTIFTCDKVVAFAQQFGMKSFILCLSMPKLTNKQKPLTRLL